MPRSSRHSILASLVEYFHYIKYGHTLKVSASNCVYNSLTYIDVIEPQETVWVQDMSVVGIAIHNFIDTSERIAPGNSRVHGQLLRSSTCARYATVEQAVLRCVLDTPPYFPCGSVPGRYRGSGAGSADGEVTLHQ